MSKEKKEILKQYQKITVKLKNFLKSVFLDFFSLYCIKNGTRSFVFP